MAIQCGRHFITGTYHNLCFYRMEGRYFVRMKSSLSRKRVKTDPALARTMQHAGLLGKAAKTASVVYRLLPKASKEMGLYRKLTGKAVKWLKEGYEAEQVTALLMGFVKHKPVVTKKERMNKEPMTGRYAFAAMVIASIAAKVYYDDAGILQRSFCHAPL